MIPKELLEGPFNRVETKRKINWRERIPETGKMIEIRVVDGVGSGRFIDKFSK